LPLIIKLRVEVRKVMMASLAPTKPGASSGEDQITTS